MVRSIFLLLLHAFLVSLGAHCLYDTFTALDMIFFQAFGDGSLNILLPLNFLILLWLIPVLLRRTDARLAWTSLLIFSLGVIVTFFLTGASAETSSTLQKMNRPQPIVQFAWGVASSGGMLVAIYLRDCLARLNNAVKMRIPKWAAAVRSPFAVLGLIITSMLIIATSAIMGEGSSEASRSLMWIGLMCYLLVCSWFVVLVTTRRVKWAMYLSLLGALVLGACALIAGERHELDLHHDGQQWVLLHPDKSMDGEDIRVSEVPRSAGEESMPRIKVEIEKEWHLDSFELVHNESHIDGNRSVHFRGWGSSDGKTSSISLVVYDRPGFGLAKLLLVSFFGLLLLMRALRAAPEGLPRCR